jgi:hypothetical protein
MNRYQTVTQSGEWHTRKGVGWNYQQKQHRKETTQVTTYTIIIEVTDPDVDTAKLRWLLEEAGEIVNIKEETN